MSDQRCRGNAEAEANDNRERDQGNANAIGRVGGGAILGDDGKEPEKCELYDALFQYRRCANGDQLACGLPVDLEFLDWLQVELATLPDRGKQSGDADSGEAATQRNP